MLQFNVVKDELAMAISMRRILGNHRGELPLAVLENRLGEPLIGLPDSDVNLRLQQLDHPLEDELLDKLLVPFVIRIGELLELLLGVVYDYRHKLVPSADLREVRLVFLL